MPNQAYDSSSMDQVRELLMGAQLKEMESRMQRQEERFQREITDMRDSLKSRVDSFENFMKSENATLMHRLKEEQAERAATLKNEQRERIEGIQAEQRERIEAMKQDRRETDEALTKLTKELVVKEESLERKLTALSGTLDNAEQELRQLMLAENARLSEKVEEKYKEALFALSSTAEQIRYDLVSRSALASLFNEAAVKLSGQSPVSDVEPAPTEPVVKKTGNKSAGS